MYSLKSAFRIYAAHQLKDQGGKCTLLHGHQYSIVLGLKTETLDEKNMIIDTYDLERVFNDFIGVDHLYLNEFMKSENPTMEEMSKFFFDGLKKDLPELYSVEVYETPESSVTYTMD